MTDAGDFSTWLASINGALRGEHGSDVPCGDCTACCTSSQFIHIEPDELDTLAKVPSELLFPAPRLPDGHVLMGYDERGHCPMLVDDRCSIYEHRPRTCRVYDCRVFAASGINVQDSGKNRIANQVRRWVFRFPSTEDAAEYRSVRAADTYLSDHEAGLAEEFGVLSPIQRSLLSVQLYQRFLSRGVGAGQPRNTTPPLSAVRVELRKKTI